MAGADSELLTVVMSGGIWSALVGGLMKYIWDKHRERVDEIERRATATNDRVSAQEREIAGLVAQRAEFANIEHRLERRIDKMEARTEADMNGMGERINGSLSSLREDINSMREAYSRLLEHLMNNRSA